MVDIFASQFIRFSMTNYKPSIAENRQAAFPWIADKGPRCCQHRHLWDRRRQAGTTA